MSVPAAILLGELQQTFYEGIFFSEKLHSGTKVFNVSVHGKFSLTPHQTGPSLAKVKYVLGFHCCKAEL